MVCLIIARWHVAGDWFLVLVFAAMRWEMALRSVLFKFEQENKMSKLSINKSKSQTVKMNYSRSHTY